MSHKHKKKSKQKEGKRNVSNGTSNDVSIQNPDLPKTQWPMGTWESHNEPEGNQLE